MKIKRIITNRNVDPNHAQSLVYEWEDDLCEYFGADLHYNKPCQNLRYSKYIPFVLNLIQTSQPAFTYEMCVYRHNGNNKKSIIPCIIDYYIHSIFKARLWSLLYWRNPLICVTSSEVYNFLSKKVGIRKARLLPLSLSDRYRITEENHFAKKYDVFIAGRQNQVLMDWFRQYCTSHPETTYVQSKRLQNGEFRFFDQAGNQISTDDSRETYIDLMRKSRACTYSTQGIDGSRSTNGYGQVTPRFLEAVACGCHPLLRYRRNADTDFFELEKFCEHIDSYDIFEAKLDLARCSEVDMKKHSAYMEKHYTSVIAKELEQMLQ